MGCLVSREVRQSAPGGERDEASGDGVRVELWVEVGGMLRSREGDPGRGR